MKKELIKKFNNGELKTIASSHITNNSAIGICHVVHGIDDKIFGYLTSGESKKFFLVKINYFTNCFRVDGRLFDLADMVKHF